jgi:prepilin-type N-terminal cleavage/methylation domain-containing protein
MRRRSAFTLLEMVTVIAIIALLVGLLIPVINEANKAMNGIRCLNNMRSIADAMKTYAKDGGGLAGNFHDSEDLRWLTVKGGPALKDQVIDGKLVKGLEANRQVFLCPEFAGNADLGGDKVICHYAIPTILSGMPLGVMRSAYYKDTSHPLPGVPLVVEPAVYKDSNDDLVNSLGTYDTATQQWTALPNGGFEEGGVLDARRHNRRVHMAFHNGGAQAIDLKDFDILANRIFIVVDDGSSAGKTITCGGMNRYLTWQKQ